MSRVWKAVRASAGKLTASLFPHDGDGRSEGPARPVSCTPDRAPSPLKSWGGGGLLPAAGIPVEALSLILGPHPWLRGEDPPPETGTWLRTGPQNACERRRWQGRPPALEPSWGPCRPAQPLASAGSAVLPARGPLAAGTHVTSLGVGGRKHLTRRTGSWRSPNATARHRPWGQQVVVRNYPLRPSGFSAEMVRRRDRHTEIHMYLCALRSFYASLYLSVTIYMNLYMLFTLFYQ